MTQRRPEDVWRTCAPRVLATLVRRYGHFDLAEDAVQEALLAAATQWPSDGLPADPQAWLTTVASRRLVDALRSQRSRGEREEGDARLTPADAFVAPGADAGHAGDVDDTLTLFVLCCHPVLSRQAQTALTLRALGGLSTAQIARALLVPETTMAQRLGRAKVRLRESGARFTLPPPAELPGRVSTVTQVLYLIFTEGHTSTRSGDLYDVSLCDEAIRLTRELYRRLPADPEIAGLLALMLLTDARRAARIDDAGRLVPLAEQDRSRWDAGRIAEGVRLVEGALPRGPVGPFQLQAAIAAVHDEATTADATDWAQIRELYGMLASIAPSRVVVLNQAVATAMVDGPRAGLAMLQPLLDDPRSDRQHRLHAVRAHLLAQAGDTTEAREEFTQAARLATSVPEQRYLNDRAAALEG